MPPFLAADGMQEDTCSHRDVEGVDAGVQRPARGDGQHLLALQLSLQGKALPFTAYYYNNGFIPLEFRAADDRNIFHIPRPADCSHHFPAFCTFSLQKALEIICAVHIEHLHDSGAGFAHYGSQGAAARGKEWKSVIQEEIQVNFCSCTSSSCLCKLLPLQIPLILQMCFPTENSRAQELTQEMGHGWDN